MLLRHNTAQFTDVMTLKIILKVDNLQLKECEAEQEHGTIRNIQSNHENLHVRNNLHMRIAIFLKFGTIQKVMQAVDQKHNYKLEWP